MTLYTTRHHINLKKNMKNKLIYIKYIYIKRKSRKKRNEMNEIMS